MQPFRIDIPPPARVPGSRRARGARARTFGVMAPCSLGARSTRLSMLRRSGAWAHYYSMTATDHVRNVHEPLADRTDRAILARLQVDGRISNVDLADAVSLSPSACLRRVKALEASGIIEGYRAEISRARAGLGLTVFVGLKVEGHSRQT